MACGGCGRSNPVRVARSESQVKGRVVITRTTTRLKPASQPITLSMPRLFGGVRSARSARK
jgi:hypothetical protein